tara:strand:+ start:199 stop:1359 length:1161 start_codon:yes stop_codon:yes gene_type:complete
MNYLNYIFLFVAINWDPLTKTVLTFDAMGRSLVILIFLVLINNILVNQKEFFKTLNNKAILLWFIWIIYNCINWYFTGFNDNYLTLPFFILIRLVLPLLVMVVVFHEFNKNKIILLKFLFFSFLFYSFIGFFILGSFDSSDQMLGVLGNNTPLNTTFLAFITMLLYYEKRISLLSLAIISAYIILIIFFSASRKAFGSLSIYYILFIVSLLTYKPIYRFLSVIIAFGFYSLIENFLYSSVLGERLLNTYDSGKIYNNTGYDFLNYFGDRLYFYLVGIDEFIKSPFNGIGLNNFIFKTQSKMVIHSEYVVQFLECGIIGITIFIFFKYWFIKRIKSLNFNDKISYVILAGFTSIIFLQYSAWTYSFCMYFVSYGILMGYLNKQKING